MKSGLLYAFAATAAFAALTGCAKNIDTIDAVKQGVLHDIPKDVNVGAMDVNVVSVSFRGKEADAMVSFAPKGGPAMMSMTYTMERQGNEWRIKSRSTGDMQKHAAQPVPEGSAMGQAPGGALPPGHPSTGATGSAGPITGDTTKLPPGHPPLNGSNK